MLHSSDLCWNLVSYAASYWATLHPSDLHCSLRTYAALYWSELNSSDLYPALYLDTLPVTVLCCTLQIYGARYTAPYLALLHLPKLRCTLLNYAAPFELRCTLPDLPLFIQFFRMLDCSAPGQYDTGVKRSADTGTSPEQDTETQSSTRPVLDWDAEIPK